MKKYKTKRKRRLKKKFYLPIILIILVVGGYFGYNQYTDYKITKLGYSSALLKPLKKMNLRQAVIKKDIYSTALEKAIIEDTYNSDYWELYFSRSEVTIDDQFLYQRLLKLKAYQKNELNTLFSELNYRELTPLLVFNKLTDINSYIEDVKINRGLNLNSFYLTTDYLNKYKDSKETDTNLKELVLVNDKNYLPENYQVNELVLIPIDCRMSEMYLDNDAQVAFVSMCHDISKTDLKIASNSAYRSFSTQEEIYNDYLLEYGQSEAERLTVRAGYSDYQTGYAVGVISLTAPSSGFSETLEYYWLLENAHKYGFIFRYPKGYESITGISFAPWHLRYVGIDVASDFVKTNLTYDEYYYLKLVE